MSDHSGFWRLPHNDLAVLLSRTDLKWESLRVYLALADLTHGYGKQKDIVSLGQIAKLSCVDRQHLTRVFRLLESLGLYGQREIAPRKVERWIIWPPTDGTCIGTSTSPGTSTKDSTQEGTIGSALGGTTGSTLEGTHQEIKKEKKPRRQSRECFDDARKAYPGTKRGLDTEWSEFVKRQKDWQAVVPLLQPAIQSQIQARAVQKQVGQWVPNWKHFRTWLSQRCWEIETDPVEDQSGNPYGTHLATEEDLARLAMQGVYI
ncbi:MAG: hypothetical protein HQ515_03880 [Phycisphaeraceae bacterium]|nr:hypothetical protein [Phycisphaeraceae bacterium]